MLQKFLLSIVEQYFLGPGALLGGPSREEGKHDEDRPASELVAKPLARQARYDPDHAANDLAAVSGWTKRYKVAPARIPAGIQLKLTCQLLSRRSVLLTCVIDHQVQACIGSRSFQTTDTASLRTDVHGRTYRAPIWCTVYVPHGTRAHRAPIRLSVQGTKAASMHRAPCTVTDVHRLCLRQPRFTKDAG